MTAGVIPQRPGGYPQGSAPPQQPQSPGGYPPGTGPPQNPQQPITHHSPAQQAHQPQPQQNYPQTLGLPAQGQWSTGLCDCFDDVPNCCLTCWCPCITFGQNAEIIDRGSSSCGVSGGLYALIAVFTGCHFIYSCTYRTKLKQQYGMPQGALEDCCMHFWCQGCAICQEYRELQHRGFDVSLGWHGNMERKNMAEGQGATNPPVAPGVMTR